MIGDTAKDFFIKYYPNVSSPTYTVGVPVISREEFDALKRDVELIKEMLIAAKKYDEKNGEPECETEEKMELLRKIAKVVGVELP
jgi:hypothetical protein